MAYSCKNVIKDLHIYNAAQYCVSVKDKNKYVSQVFKSVNFKSVTSNLKIIFLNKNLFSHFNI